MRMKRCSLSGTLLWSVCLGFCTTSAQEQPAVALPVGIKPVWDLAKAHHETAPTRERVSINGLWRWQPVSEAAAVPTGKWGYYKVPAAWPGIQDYMQSDYQTLFPHPAWASTRLGEVAGAWYQRTITIPKEWQGRRITLDVEYLNSYAAIYIDGRQVGEMRFPAGRLDLSRVVLPGATHVLTMQVLAMPLRAVMESYTDTNAARQRKGTVQRRGLCGDVWLTSEPAGARLGEIGIATSVRAGTVTVKADVGGLPASGDFRLRVKMAEDDKAVAEFTSPAVSARAVNNGVLAFTHNWRPQRLWDLHTPQNQYTAEVSLIDAEGRTLDTALPIRFGFREFWIEGRDFYLNGTRLFLSLVSLDNAQVGAALSTYEGAKESFLRLKSFGINFVYGHNYGCEPGAHLSFSEILRAADDTGMLVALSQPHFSAYDWKAPDADLANGYADHAAFYVQVAGNHPSVVAYSMSHNATGYNQDMNPLMIDGKGDPREQWSARNAAAALRCEKIVQQLDPERIVYHHSSGNLSAMYTINFYPNFVPVQEMDDWFEHWATVGVKPVLLVEYGAPFGWDWTMYRGWHDSKREFGSAAVPWEYCLAEWNAQFLGPAAYDLSEREKRNLRWEAQQFKKGRGWYRWDYPLPVGDERLDELHPVQEAYTTSNWRAFRTWGLSGNSPWEHSRFWKLRDGFQARRRELPVDWENLQRPGYSPDFMERTYERFDLAYERSDWAASPTAESLVRNNGPVLAWIAGGPARFTGKEHIFYPGETAEKQLIIINNSRERITGDATWAADVGPGVKGSRRVVLETGNQLRIPLANEIPATAKPGDYTLHAKFTSPGVTQEDTFVLHVVQRPKAPELKARIAVFDPPGETARWLNAKKVAFQPVDAAADLQNFDLLIVGRKALALERPAPVLARVREGLKVLVFEQTSEVLEKRLGFRVQEYGLRQVWPRVPDSPVLARLSPDLLRDWRGDATLLPPTLEYKLSSKYNGAPAVTWCGLEVTRLWRCGNWGNVASVLIEKPHRGDFLPLLDGGYALQYSPLLEYREGRGVVLFCQVDVTGRAEPAAEILAGNILAYLDSWQPAARRSVLYAGDSAGLDWLKAAGVQTVPFSSQSLDPNHVLVASSGTSSEHRKSAAAWARQGGHVLALGLSQSEAAEVLPPQLKPAAAEYINSSFAPFGASSVFAGIAPADVHNRDPRVLAVVNGGVLAEAGTLAVFQVPPFIFGKPMQDPATGQFNLRRTFGRTSFTLSRTLGNLGVSGSTPLLDRFSTPVEAAANKSEGKEGRWLEGFYLTRPTEWDDPYRFFRW